MLRLFQTQQRASKQSNKQEIVWFVQVAPVVDASSSQSRTDVLVILLSAVLLLTGLQWLAVRPKVKPSVSLYLLHLTGTACAERMPSFQLLSI